MKEYFHVSPEKNRVVITVEGLRPSAGGLDVPGLYVWRGPSHQAIVEAYCSLIDNHEGDESKLRGLDVYQLWVPDEVAERVSYPEYAVLDIGGPVQNLQRLGYLLDLFEDAAKIAVPLWRQEQIRQQKEREAAKVKRMKLE